MKIIVFNSNPNQVYGTSRGDNTDEAVAAKFSELLTKDNVYGVDEDDILTARTELLEILQATVTPSASYDCQGLEVTSLVDDSDGTNYYFFFNEKDLNYEEAGESSSGGFNPGMGSDYSKKDFSALTTAVTLKGTGTPYLVDPMTGEITPVAEYTVLEDGRVQFDLSMEALNTMIVAVTENTTDFPAPVAQVKEATGEGELVYVDGETLYRSETSGDSAVISYADGSWKTAAVGEVPAKIELGGDTLWNLDIESWGPDAEVNEYDPSLSKKVNITAGETALKLWKELTISEEELAKTGASSAEVLSGIGTYTKTITLPDTWPDDMGATLTFEHKGMVKSGGNPWGGGSTTETLQNNDDEITRITVTNAKGTFEVNDVNPLNDFVEDVYKRQVQGCTDGQDGDILTFTLDVRLADRDFIGFHRHAFLVELLAHIVNSLAFAEDNRVGAVQSGSHQALCIIRGSREDNLQARDMSAEGSPVLRMLCTVLGADGHTHDNRHLEDIGAHGLPFCQLVEDFVAGAAEEVHIHQLGDYTAAGQCVTDSGADDSSFRNRGVEQTMIRDRLSQAAVNKT